MFFHKPENINPEIATPLRNLIKEGKGYNMIPKRQVSQAG